MDGLKDLLVGLKHLQLRIAENITSKVKHLHTYWNWNPYLHKYYQLLACLVSLTSRKITYEVLTIMLNDNENNIHNINIKYKWNKIDGVNAYLRTSTSCSNCPCNRRAQWTRSYTVVRATTNWALDKESSAAFFKFSSCSLPIFL